MEVALKLHTLIIVFYTVCLILLFLYGSLYFGMQVVGEAFDWAYREMDPEQKKQIMETLGGYKNLPETDSEQNKQI